MYFYIIFIFFNSAEAANLIETGVATGINNTLQQKATLQPKEFLNKAQNAVNKYEEDQQRRLELEGNPIKDPSNEEDQQRYLEEDQQRHLELEADPIKDPSNEEEKKNQDENSNLVIQNTKPVDYESSIQVFYKKDCSNLPNNCQRGAVLTNIKSVIFDYAHARGSFAKPSKESE